MAASSKFNSFPISSEMVWQVDFRPLRVPDVLLEPEEAPSDLNLWLCYAVDPVAGFAIQPKMISGKSKLLRETTAHLADTATAHPTGHLPGTIEVTNANLAKELEKHLGPLGVRVEVKSSLPGVDALEAFYNDNMASRLSDAPAFFDESVPPDLFQAFHHAAMEFEKRALWKDLHDDDLIEIESPATPNPVMRCVSVMGAGGQEFGLAFFRDEAAFGQMYQAADETPSLPDSAYSLLFQSMDDLTSADRELLRRHQLPVSQKLGVPFLLHFARNKPQRATADEMAFVVGLSLALSQTALAEIDSGAWEKVVHTSRGEVAFKFRVPSIVRYLRGESLPTKPLEPGSRWGDYNNLVMGRLLQRQKFRGMNEANAFLQKTVVGKTLEEWRPPAANDIERAEDLAYAAIDAPARVSHLMAKKALQLDPDCAAALLLLGENSTVPSDKITYLAEAVQAGERRLKLQGAFDDPKFPFWQDPATRPYMRAMFDLAYGLSITGDHEKALPYYRKLLKLNPGDNQGVRYELARVLLSLGHLDELDQLLNASGYEKETSADWLFVKALLAYRRNDPHAARDLSNAMRANRHAADYLTGEQPLPRMLPSHYSPGETDEAILLANDQRAIWEQTPGALQWLFKARKESSASSPAKGKKTAGRGRK